MASALSILSRLGYSLASESGSPAASDGLDRERISEESTPTALLSHVQPLNSFATQLNLNHGSSSILSAAASAPGLAGLGLSAVRLFILHRENTPEAGCLLLPKCPALPLVPCPAMPAAAKAKTCPLLQDDFVH